MLVHQLKWICVVVQCTEMKCLLGWIVPANVKNNCGTLKFDQDQQAGTTRVIATSLLMYLRQPARELNDVPGSRESCKSAFLQPGKTRVTY